MLTLTKRNRVSGMVSMVAVGMMTLAMPGQARADLATAIQDGADRVASLQNVDGKWGWPLNAPPTFNNITGPIGLGMINAYGQTNDPAHLASATDAGNALDGLTANWVGTYNPMFMVALFDETGNNAYLNQAQSFFNALTAGTYERGAIINHDTTTFITAVQTEGGRAAQWINLRPWEFAPLTYAASRAGTPAQQAAFLQATKDGIETLDSSDPNTAFSDLLGLAGGVMGLSQMNVDFDPTAGAFASASSTADMADILAGNQNVNGSWYWHSNLAAPAADDEDLQTTAYALLALLEANDLGQYDDEIVSGRNYLLGQQQVNGGWISPGGSENAEVDGEVLWALSATAGVVPEPASMALLGLGGLAMLKRKRV
jgi:PEP-CTERM motif